MATNLESGFGTTLALPLAPADTTMTVATVPTKTSGRVYLNNGEQEERISYTGISGSTLTGLTRNLSQTADPATGGTGLTWIAGTEVILVVMHDQLVDKTASNTYATGTVQTFPDIDFTGTTTQGLRVKNVTTAQRTSMTPSNGAIVYDSTIGELYQYIGGAWSAISAGSTQPNASTTVAGKVELPTTAEFLSKTDTGGTGASLTPTPSQIRKILQTRLTAGENLTAGLWAYADVDGKAYKGVRTVTTPAQVGSVTGIDTTTSFKELKVDYLSDNTAICVYKKASDDRIYGTVVSFTRSTITVGTEQVISTALDSTRGPELCVLSSSLFVVGYIKNASNPHAVACTVSGTTITAGTEVAMAGSSGPEANSVISICKATSSKFAIAMHVATNDDPEVILGTISGTTITAGTAIAMDAVTMTAGSSVLIQYVSDDVLLLVYDNGTNFKAVTMTVSGTVPTGGSGYDIGIAGSLREGDQLMQIDSGRFLLILNQSALGVKRVITLNVPNTSTNSTPVVGSNYYLTNDTTTGFYLSNFYYLGNNMIAWLSGVTNGNKMRLRILRIGYNDMQLRYDTTIAGTVGDLACCKLLTDQSKILMVYRDTGTTNLNYSLYWNTENQSIGIVGATVLSGAETAITGVGAETLSTTYTAGLPYYFADAGLIATSGTKQIGITLTTTSLLLK